MRNRFVFALVISVLTVIPAAGQEVYTAKKEPFVFNVYVNPVATMLYSSKDRLALAGGVEFGRHSWGKTVKGLYCVEFQHAEIRNLKVTGALIGRKRYFKGLGSQGYCGGPSTSLAWGLFYIRNDEGGAVAFAGQGSYNYKLLLTKRMGVEPYLGLGYLIPLLSNKSIFIFLFGFTLSSGIIP